VKSSVKSSSSNYVLAVFIDFKGAFDYFSWSSLMQRLQEVGCEEMALWKSYFSGRWACAVGVNDTAWVDVTRGCPQESICSPFIWNVMMDTLLRQLEEHCQCCASADDLLVLAEGRSRLEVERKGSEIMHILCEGVFGLV